MSSAPTRTVDDRSRCLHRPSSVLVAPTMDRGAANRLQTCATCDNRGKSSSRGIEGPLSDTIEFQLLGATEARRDGEPVPLSGARRRALVARLLLDADRVVRADALIEDVWDGSPRPAAMATLQSHISQLRKVLGDRLQSQAAGYVLRTDSVIVDAAEFERQAEAGAAQLSASDAAAARTTLRGALARGGTAGPCRTSPSDRGRNPKRRASKSCAPSRSSICWSLDSRPASTTTSSWTPNRRSPKRRSANSAGPC